MINLIWPSSNRYEPKSPVTLSLDEIEEYDFSDAAEQIFDILSVLELCKLLPEIPYESSSDVYDVIQNLVDDIDLGSDEVQISEFRYIRVEFRDEMLAVEAYVGV